MDDEILINEGRSEEIQNIIERMPTKFGFYVTILVLLIFTVMLCLSWTIKYPDVVIGQVVVSMNSNPIKLVSSSSGKLKFVGVKNKQIVNEDQVLAYLENSCPIENFLYLDSLLENHKLNYNDIASLKSGLPIGKNYGELNSLYYNLVNSVDEYASYRYDRPLEKQIENLKELRIQQKQSLLASKNRISSIKTNLEYAYKFFKRDSVLFKKKVISESELDKSQINLEGSKDAVESAISLFVGASQELKVSEGKLSDLSIQNLEKEKSLTLAVQASYNQLLSSIKLWEEKYLFKSPIKGQVQFLRFYNENQFIQQGESVCAIIPKAGKTLGNLYVPASGSGKIKRGQEVIIKLDSYPFKEYGSLKGRVGSMSLTSNSAKTEKSEIETYLIGVDFPQKLTTNYGVELTFNAEEKGSAEIITNDRRFIERVFENLRYISSR
jgi:multidrug resistance efflux pump